ncbi:MAG: DNA polymerase III subunit gamma/tau [bacterium]|nr:DNA polymerase III subunit gamma/tau [bacterium]
MTTLYRKYRPQTFSDVTGQEHIIQTITNEISTNRVAHSYLFSGPRGVGKTTTARLLAKAVNCAERAEGKFEPCEACDSCTEITQGCNLDVMEIDAASQTGVDNVRDNIIENTHFQPTKSKYKIFIIDEVHMLSTPAFNALLKTLEEPPAYIIFILATTELHKVLDTVVSRCQRFTFKKINAELMLARLQAICKDEGIKVEEMVLQRIIGKSDGCLRDAESLLGQIMSIGLKKITAEDAAVVLPAADIETVLKFIASLLNHQAAEAIALLDEATSAGTSADQFSYNLIETLRVIMIYLATGGATAVANNYSPEQIKTIRELSKLAGTTVIISLLETAMTKRQQIKSSPIPQLPLEILAVQFGSGQNNHPVAPPPNAVIAKPIKEKDAVATKMAETKSTSKILTTLEQIKNKWSEIMTELSETQHSLVFILKMCELRCLDAAGLCLTVPFSLHRDKITEPKNKKLLEDKLLEKFGERISIACETPLAASDAEMSNLAADFGGELI